MGGWKEARLELSKQSGDPAGTEGHQGTGRGPLLPHLSQPGEAAEQRGGQPGLVASSCPQDPGPRPPSPLSPAGKAQGSESIPNWLSPARGLWARDLRFL